MPSTVDGVASVILGVVVLGSAIGMLSTRNIVHAAFWMLGVDARHGRLLHAAVGRLRRAGADHGVRGRRRCPACSSPIMLTLRRREDAIRSRDFSWQALGACGTLRRRDLRRRARRASRLPAATVPVRPGHRRVRQPALQHVDAAVRSRLVAAHRRARRRGVVVGGREGPMRVGVEFFIWLAGCAVRAGTLRRAVQALGGHDPHVARADGQRGQHQPRRAVALSDAAAHDGQFFAVFMMVIAACRDRSGTRARSRSVSPDQDDRGRVSRRVEGVGSELHRRHTSAPRRGVPAVLPAASHACATTCSTLPIAAMTGSFVLSIPGVPRGLAGRRGGCRRGRVEHSRTRMGTIGTNPVDLILQTRLRTRR